MLKDEILRCRRRLSLGGIENAAFEAACIAEYITGFDRARQTVHYADELSAEQAEQFNSITEKRLTRYPLQYLLKSWSFMGINLCVGEGVLIPRDDTEVCTRLCLDYLGDKPCAKAADLCSGSGAIALALEQFAKADVTAVELSGEAFKFLKKNIELNGSGVVPVLGDVFEIYRDFPDGCFDLIVSNPPYIITDELKTLQEEVRFEPETALDGGIDGLVFYRGIVKNWSRKLKNGGALVFELGEGQAQAVAEMMKAQGFENIKTALDFGGEQRAIIGTLLSK